MESGDGFGLFHSEVAVARRDPLVVFPRVRPLPDLGIRPEDPFACAARRAGCMRIRCSLRRP